MNDRRFPPGPSAFRALSGLRNFGRTDLRSVPRFLTEVAREFGPIAHWKLFGRHFFLLDDPVLIEDALVFKERDFLRGRGVQKLRPLLGNGLLTAEEPLHLRQRRMIQPAFHRDRIAAYGRQMVELTSERIARWQPGSLIDVQNEMTDLTLAIAAKTLFSTDVGAEAQTIRCALTSVMEAFPAAMATSELLEALPFLPARRRFDRARRQLDGVIYGMIAARRAQPADMYDDLLAMLLGARDDAAAMDDLQVRDEVLTLFTAGHETTANALAWAWYLLARFPAAADRLESELAAVLGGRVPKPGDLPALRFTRDVFAEALRLYPPGWIVGRRAARATTIGSYDIPAGSIVLSSPLVTGRNPRYFSAPDTFAPERWSSAAAPPRFAYFPFGGGSRRCIGESFAWMEGTLVLATIAQRFRFTAADPAAIDYQPFITLRPRTPIRVRAVARATQPA